MNWTVSKGLFKSTLHGTTPGMGLAIYHKGASYALVDDSRKTVFTVTAQGPLRYIIAGAAEATGSAELVLADKAPAFFPPRAAWLHLRLEDKAYQLEQCENRDFIVYANDAAIGTITSMLQRKPLLSLPDTMGAVYAALLYTLALIMLHEDDMALV